MFTWPISGSSQRKAGHERSKADCRGECGHVEVLQEYVLWRDGGLCSGHTGVLGSVPGPHNGQYRTLCTWQEPRIKIRMHTINPLMPFQTMLLLSCAVHAASYQFMAFMSKAKLSETGSLVDSGSDLNMEGGLAE